MEVKKSEDCLIFYGLTPKVTKMRPVYDSLSDFMRKKQTIDPSDRFNIIVYLEDGPNYLDHFTFYPDHVLKTLKSLRSDIISPNIAGAIFVAITFIIEVFKKISEKTFRLLILIDHGTPKIPHQFIRILEDLIDTVKDMPFFIDVVCIDKKSSQENSNLTRLVEITNGKFVKIKSVRDINSVLATFSEKKYVFEKKPVIFKRNQPFFINLADNLLALDKIAVCSICFQRDDYGIVQCPSCETAAHKTCWFQWAKTSNIGIPHVFRCHNCFNILKQEENFVPDVHAKKFPVEKHVKKIDIAQYLHELENNSEPKIIQVIDPMASDGDSVEHEKKIRRTPLIKVLICPNCSEMTTNLKTKCPRCGFSL